MPLKREQLERKLAEYRQDYEDVQKRAEGLLHSLDGAIQAVEELLALEAKHGAEVEGQGDSGGSASDAGGSGRPGPYVGPGVVLGEFGGGGVAGGSPVEASGS